MKPPKKASVDMPCVNNQAVSVAQGSVAALVLCKGELYFQSVTGKTLKIEYPRSVAQGRQAAKELGVEFSEQ